MEFARMGGRVYRVIVSINPLGRPLRTCASYPRDAIHAREPRFAQRGSACGGAPIARRPFALSGKREE